MNKFKQEFLTENAHFIILFIIVYEYFVIIPRYKDNLKKKTS